MKIARIDIENFRGIGGRVSLDCSRPNGGALSVILLGDNGAGKSSVVDAIEFALRGRLSRRGVEGTKKRREVQNLRSKLGPPGVVIEFADGRELRRGGGLADSGIAVTFPGSVMAGFEKCPVIIRRQDIESFWSVEPTKRQDYFFDYLRQPGVPVVSTASRQEREDRYQDAQIRLDAAATALLSLTKGSADKLPRSLRGSRGYLHNFLLPKFGNKGADGRWKVPNPIWRAFLEFQAAIEERNRTEGDRARVDDASAVSGAELQGLLGTLTGRVSEDFLTTANLSWVHKVRLAIGRESELTIALELSDGSEVDPLQVLSEASLDLLALLVLIEVHIACVELGQARIIVLDDVFQSVDTVHRIRSLDHILSRLRGWQVVVTLHDRLWMELARLAMQRSGHQNLACEVRASTEPNSPPLIMTARMGPLEDLRQALKDGSSSAIVAGSTGLLLEQLADRLSVSLGTSVTRRRGDFYTLGDLWSGVSSALRKHVPVAISEVEEVDRFLTLRNMIGAHYNEWALSLAREEALDFARAAISLWEATTCKTCGSSISRFTPVAGSARLFALPCKC